MGSGAGGATPLTALYRPRRKAALARLCFELAEINLSSPVDCNYTADSTGDPLDRSSRGSNSVPSLQIAYMMPASLRARATTAVGLPRRCAILAHHSCNAFVLSVFHRSSAQAASTSSDRAPTLPALLIRPRCRRSPELYSRGTSPK